MTRRRPGFNWYTCLLIAQAFTAVSARAHIGNPTTIYEGLAGTVPVRVSVRVPTVVPGLAEINVRVLTNGVTRVTALPAHWQSGPEGRPPPDVCVPVSGETNLYHTELWLMVRGAYSVNVQVETAHGSGQALVPINAIATAVLPMPRLLGGLLAGLGLLLFALAAAVVGAAVRESVLAPGLAPSRTRRWVSRGAGVVAGGVLALSLWGGWHWWQAEARNYRENRVHKPARARAEIRGDANRPSLRLTMLPPDSANPRARVSGLVPDHGKMMHLFLIREKDGAGFAHLHPSRSNDVFECALPPLVAGRYQVFADVTHETGFSQTLTSSVDIAVSAVSAPPAPLTDPDDTWCVSSAERVSGETVPLGDGFQMRWDRNEPMVAGRETTLRFRVLDGSGAPADIEPYLSMLAHAILWREDGAVFTHLHPAGTVSVASQQVFQLRAGEGRARRITPEMMEALCQPPGTELRRLPLSFPYEFPQPGHYRLWVQAKVGGAVRTGVFDADVTAGR